MPTPVDIYVAVAEKDADACAKFEQHLATFVSRGALRVFHRHKLNAGDNLETSLNQYFGQARIVVLLRTIRFENDTRCKQEEDWAYQQVGTKPVISVIVRDHNWNKTRAYPLGLVHLPRNGQPVEGANEDAAWTNVAREINEVAKRVSAPYQAQAYAAPTPSRAPYHPPAPVPQVMHPRQTYVAYPPAASPPKQNPYSILIKLIGLGLFGFGIYYYAMTSSSRETTPTTFPTTFPTTTSTTSPTTFPANLSPNQCPSPCCGGSSCALNAEDMHKLCPDPNVPCCPSGRKCVPLGCGEKLAASQHYNMRLAHATINGREPSMGAEICFHRIASGIDRKCVLYSSAQANSKDARATPPQLIPILLGDVLTGKGIEVEIWENGRTSLAAKFTTAHDNLKATALCMGMKLAQPGNPDNKVFVFLDDP